MPSLTIGLVEASPRSGEQSAPRVYLPYSTGMLRAYAQRHAGPETKLRFLEPVAWRIPIDKAVDRLREADVVAFSSYVWNGNYSLALARALKQDRPDRLIVFGGPHVPDRAQSFLESNRCVDLAVHGEGERVFLEVLGRARYRDWDGVSSISYLDRGGCFRTHPKTARAQELASFPSPYLAGLFEPLFEAYPHFSWHAVWETNRGCPFSCTFCDWGSATASKVYRFDMPRLAAEADWMGRHKLDHIFIADANFGILPRDVELAGMLTAALEKYDTRVSLCIQMTKNATSRSLEIHELLARSGRVMFEPTVSVQSIDRPTLLAIKRDNISLTTFQEVQRRAQSRGIDTYTDVIIGLPGESYDSFANGIAELIRRGQHNKLNIYNCQVLPNAEMAQPEYRERFGIECVDLPLSLPAQPGTRSPYPVETIATVIATRSMPREAWVRARTMAWMTSFLHTGRVLQTALIVAAETFQISYRTLLESFIDACEERYPLLGRIHAGMSRAALETQAGRHCFQYDHGRWWTPDAYPLVWLAAEDRFDSFYRECHDVLASCCPKAGAGWRADMLYEAVRYCQELLAAPGGRPETTLRWSYDFLDFQRRILTGAGGALNRRETACTIQRAPHGNTLAGWLDVVSSGDAKHRLCRITEVPVSYGPVQPGIESGVACLSSFSG